MASEMKTPAINQQVVLITGSSRGIGAATALKFAGQGYAICLNYRRDSGSAEKLQRQILRMNVPCISVKADVSIEEDVLRLFSSIDKTFGRLDCLVNNAGVVAAQQKLVDMQVERIRHLFNTNVISSFLCCREAVRRMSTDSGGRGGRIINVSSVAARTGSPNEYIDYAATKGAIDTLTTGLATEVAAQGIRVNAVRPGFIDTQMHADGGEPDRIKRLTPVIPLRRGGEAEEVAEAIYWLASEASSYTTGILLDVAGGR